MTHPFDAFAELRDLLDALCEEAITPEQVRRLEELVLAHPEAEAYYVQYMALYADLDRHFSVLPATTEQALRDRLGAGLADNRGKQSSQATTETRPIDARRRRRLGRWGSLGLSALAAGLLLALVLRKPSTTPTPSNAAAEPVDNTVAVLLQARAADWEETGLPTRPGAPLPPGWLRLKSGFAQIEFYNGATVILQGPAAFQLISRSEGYCERGKLRATVPPQAQGFRIGSPKLDLVDRGTEFGLEVGAGDSTEVHVFQGKVELHNPDVVPRPAQQ
jgi:ferric-dicitrate binding protein FerR (iron transport regulator)